MGGPNQKNGKRIVAQPLDPRSSYLARLREIVDLEVIKKAGLRVVYDPLWGAARGIPMRCCAMPASMSPRFTTIATYCSEDMLPSRTDTCSTRCATR